MTIKAGERMPEGKFKVMTESGPKDLTSAELFDGKKVVLFAVPGAFTPTCDARHLPGYVEHAEQLRAKGVDTIACLAVNDVFVMNAWGKAGQRRQGADARGWQRRLHARARPGARCAGFRHGAACPAFCDRGLGWRGPPEVRSRHPASSRSRGGIPVRQALRRWGLEVPMPRSGAKIGTGARAPTRLTRGRLEP